MREIRYGRLDFKMEVEEAPTQRFRERGGAVVDVISEVDVNIGAKVPAGT